MGKLKRLCMIAFVVAAVLGIGVLAVQWFAWKPLLPVVAQLASLPWFFVVEAVLLGITAAGLLVVLARALTAPGKSTHLEVSREGGSVSITKGALQSTVRHVVEGHRGLAISTIKTSIAGRRNPRLRVQVKVEPGRNAELSHLGATLQSQIAASLEAFTGYPVDAVHITFVGDASVVTPAFTQQAAKSATESASAKMADGNASISQQDPVKPLVAHATE